MEATFRAIGPYKRTLVRRRLREDTDHDSRVRVRRLPVLHSVGSAHLLLVARLFQMRLERFGDWGPLAKNGVGRFSEAFLPRFNFW